MKKTIKYFSECKTEAQVKKIYRKLSHMHHPDKPGGDKETFQEIEKQKKEALRRIAISEGRALSYYEELAAKAGKADFASSIIKVAKEIDVKLEAEGVIGNDFGAIFNAVAKIFYDPKKENKIEEKKNPESLPGKFILLFHNPYRAK